MTQVLYSLHPHAGLRAFSSATRLYANFLVAAATLTENIRQTLSAMRWRKCRKCWKSSPDTWLEWLQWLRPKPLRHRKTKHSFWEDRSKNIKSRTEHPGVDDFIATSFFLLLNFSLSPRHFSSFSFLSRFPIFTFSI
jgi:hypothetical protein